MQALQVTIQGGRSSAQQTAGLGLRVEPNDEGHTLRVTEVTEGGQCGTGGATEGMLIVGINGEALESNSVKDFADKVKATEKPLVLNFNKLPESKQQQNSDHDEEFAALMAQGLEVNKHHKSGNLFNTSAKRVLYTDGNKQTIICGKSKGAATQKVYSVHEITNIGVSKGKGEQHKVLVQTKDDKKALKLALPTPKAASLLARRLTRMCSDEQRKGGGVVHCKGDSTPVSP